jgi:anti-sigma factor RsiW
MECREMFARLSEYLDGELTDELCAEIRAHMGDCVPCQAFSRSLRNAVDLCRRLPATPLPEDVKRELAALLDHLPHRD